MRSSSRTHLLSELEHKIGYQFKQPKLLQQALTHRSYAADHYERLEFLGDGVLNCTIAFCLYQQFKGQKEGELSRIRTHLVRQEALVVIAQTLGLSHYLLLGDGELKSGGAQRPSILADTVEAIFGAVFCDADFATAQAVVTRLYQPMLAELDPNTAGKDAKTQLQERLQAQKLPVPTYTILATEGAAHEQTFTMQCAINALNITTQGAGASRRIAEQAAALVALNLLNNSPKQKK